MATKPKHPKAQDLAADADVLALIEEAQLAAEDEIAALRRDRAEALKQVARDPKGASAKVREIDSKIEDAIGRQQTLADALAQEATERAQSEAKQRVADAAADRANVVRISQRRVNELAPEVDALFDQLVAAVTRLRDAGAACDAFARRAIATEHSETFRIHDRLSLVLPRATGTGADAAAALAHQFMRVAKALGSPNLAQFVEFNQFMPYKPCTLTAAALLDHGPLQAWFDPQPDADAQPATSQELAA